MHPARGATDSPRAAPPSAAIRRLRLLPPRTKLDALPCFADKNVMTQAKQKASLRQSHGGAEWWDGTRLWPHGTTMDAARSERTLRFGRTKQIGGIVKGEEKSVSARKHLMEKTRVTKGSHEEAGAERGQDKRRGRKLYPLRRRGGRSHEEGRGCHVLLTRLEESSKPKERKDGSRSKHGKRREQKVLPKSNAKTSYAQHVGWGGLQPRKRRLASLNAEAVNSLLLERPIDAQPAAKLAKTQEDSGRDPDPDAPRALSLQGNRTSTSHKLHPPQSSKRPKKAKGNRSDRSVWMCPENLDAPAPRRLAGLNAAALLKLTSSSATSRQRVKATPTATVASDSTAPAGGSAPKQHQRVKHNRHAQKGKKCPPVPSVCKTCKKMTDYEPEVEWETSGCSHQGSKPGYQSGSLLAYPLKQVKEEQLEAELSPFYCCPPEGSVEYCHRLAFFLSQQPYPDSDDKALSAASPPVKHECLVAPPSLPHSHPHPALTLSHHPCLCTTDPCFCSYYVHIAHPTHTAAPSATLATPPLGFTPSGLCPNHLNDSKLLGGRVSHPPGLTHPYCNTVTSTCCGIGGYACNTMPPVTSRGCSFGAGCPGCGRSIKTESYPPSEDPPSLLIAPNLPLSSCPLSSGPTSTQADAHLLTPLSGRGRPPPRLRLVKAFPQSDKASNASPSVGRARVPPKQTAPSLSGASKQKKVGRRRTTNGWRPVGAPTEREVFIAGEDETCLRRCYEGVERDGEVIRLRDTVLLRSGPRKKSLPYVAKISALWEDPKTGELMMSLFWYYRPEHTQGGRDPRAHCENEIFASRHQDENSVACIEDRCYVLPLAQYCR
uniref:BAH domain-containing protein n=1 Tax=Oryzias latipes TaxID=8090 RepID=A0A3P9JXN1_ORYLA